MIMGVHKVSLDVIEAIYIEKTIRFGWEPWAFTQNDDLGVCLLKFDRGVTQDWANKVQEAENGE
jgi:hypothetical protein